MSYDLRAACADDAVRLFGIWNEAVKATHGFLNERDYLEIAELVRDKYIPNASFVLAVDADDVPLAFMGMSSCEIDSLFVHPEAFGKGVGGVLLDHAKSQHDRLTLDVNEQNEGAYGFYLKKGFQKIGRSDTDDHGRPYPLIHMEWRC